MTKVNIAFRVHPWHYEAIKEEIAKGNRLTVLFEDMLNKRYPVSSKANLKGK